MSYLCAGLYAEGPTDYAFLLALLDQLVPGGTLIAPVGAANAQSLVKLVKRADGDIDEEVLAPVVFVPLLSGTVD